MLFKSALFVSYIGLLVLKSGAAPNRHNEASFRSRRVSEDFEFSVLPRHGLPYRNSTVQATSKSTTSSTVAISRVVGPGVSSISESSTAPVVGTTQPLISSYGPELPWSTSIFASATSRRDSDNGIPISTTNDISTTSAYSSTQAQRSYTTRIVSATTSAEGVISDKILSLASSSDVHTRSKTNTKLTTSDLKPTPHGSSTALSGSALTPQSSNVQPTATNLRGVETYSVTSSIRTLSNVDQRVDLSSTLASTMPSHSVLLVNSSLPNSLVPALVAPTTGDQSPASHTPTATASYTLAAIISSMTLGTGELHLEPTVHYNASSTAERSFGMQPAESGAVTTITRSSMTLNIPKASPTSLSLLNSTLDPAGDETAVHTARTSRTILPTGVMLSRSNILSTQPTSMSESNSTWSISTLYLPKPTKGFSSSTNTSFHCTTTSIITSSKSSQPTGAFSNSNRTQLQGWNTTATPGLRNSTIANTTRASILIAGSSVTTPTGFPSSIPDDASYETTKTLPTTSTPTSTATETAAALPPPLTTPQAAGVAVGSTAGVLLAVVAAIFIARRYHATRTTRRSSTASVYPKEAYLYDPPARGSSGDGDDNNISAFSSRGTDGMSPRGFMLREPQNISDSDQHFSTGATNRYSDPGNPFRDPGPQQTLGSSTRNSFLAPTDAAAALSAAIAGYAVASQWSPATPEFQAPQPYRDLDFPSPTLSASHRRHRSYAGATSRSNSTYTQMSMSISTSQSSPTSEHPSFEHDLLLLVNPRTETPESVMLYAPPLTPKLSAQQTLPSKSPTASTSQKSLISPLSSKMGFTSDKPTSRPEQYSLAYDRQSSTTYIGPSSDDGTPTQPFSPVSPISPPIHKGWDEIKRYSSESRIPPPLPTSPPLNFSPPHKLSLPPTKKRSLIQLRRKEPALAGTGQAIISSTSHPLTVQIPFKYNKSTGFEGPRASLFAKLNNMGDARRHGVYSPGFTTTESGHSTESMRKGEGEVARAKLTVTKS